MIAPAQQGHEPAASIPVLARRLQLLCHLIESSGLIPIVTGDAGFGKSTLVRQLAAHGDGKWHVCQFVAAPEDHPLAVMKAVARCCDVPTDCGLAAMGALLREFAADVRHSARLPVILVDDGHHLGMESLRALAGLTEADANGPGWRLVITSEPGLRERLERSAPDGLKSHQIHLLHLRALTTEQSVEFVRSRLPWNMEISGDRVRKACRGAAGVPAELETVAQGLMDSGAATPPPTPTPAPDRRRPLLRLALPILLAVALVLVVLVNQEHINGLFQDPVAGNEDAGDSSAILARRKPPVLPPVAPEPADAMRQSSPAPEPEVGLESEPAPLQAAPVASSEIASSGDALERKAPLSSPGHPRAEPPVGAAPETEPPGSAQVPVQSLTAAPSGPSAPEEGGSVPMETTPVEASPGDIEAPRITPAVRAESQPEATPETSADRDEARKVSASATDMAKPDSQGASASAPDDPLIEGVQGRPWILAQDPAQLTLQLLGSREIKPLQAAAAELELQPRAVYRIEYQGKDWYVLLGGSFAARDEALAARQRLNDALRRNGPWPRSFGSIQEEIRRGRK